MDNFKSPQTFEPLYKSSRVCDFDLRIEKRCYPKVAQKSGWFYTTHALSPTHAHKHTHTHTHTLAHQVQLRASNLISFSGARRHDCVATPTVTKVIFGILNFSGRRCFERFRRNVALTKRRRRCKRRQNVASSKRRVVKTTKTSLTATSDPLAQRIRLRIV